MRSVFTHQLEEDSSIITQQLNNLNHTSECETNLSVDQRARSNFKSINIVGKTSQLHRGCTRYCKY